MIDINAIWEKAKTQALAFSDDEIQALINNRLNFVTDRLSTISTTNRRETLFDLMMLFFDSLNDKREAVLNLYDSCSKPSIVCAAQAQILGAIDSWHQALNLHWSVGRYAQNLLFLCALIYTASVWKEDTSADSSKVMAKIDELISWIESSKSAPFDLIEKIKSKIVV